mgnify:CR=1 FL=1
MSDTEHKSNPVVLFLDDDENRTKAFVSLVPYAKCATTAAGMIKLLHEHIAKKIKIDSLFLDHDLGGEVYVDSNREDCGMEVVRWLCANLIKPEEINTVVVHTMNPSASTNMRAALIEAGLRTITLPFHLVLGGLKAFTLPLQNS